MVCWNFLLWKPVLPQRLSGPWVTEWNGFFRGSWTTAKRARVSSWATARSTAGTKGSMPITRCTRRRDSSQLPWRMVLDPQLLQRHLIHGWMPDCCWGGTWGEMSYSAMPLTSLLWSSVYVFIRLLNFLEAGTGFPSLCIHSDKTLAWAHKYIENVWKKLLQVAQKHERWTNYDFNKQGFLSSLLFLALLVFIQSS